MPLRPLPRLLALALILVSPAFATAVHLGNGLKIGEVSADAAVLWTRLTAAPDANWTGAPFRDPQVGADQEALRAATLVQRASAMSEAAVRAAAEADPTVRRLSGGEMIRLVTAADWRSQLPPGRVLAEMEGALPGAPGSVRFTLSPVPSGPSRATDWLPVNPEADYTRQVRIDGLEPGRAYRVQVESRDASGKPGATLAGAFRTAPPPAAAAPVRFAVVTCGDYPRRDDPANGHRIYDTLRRQGVDFLVHTGDVEYYDKPDPWATSATLARFKWNRLFALPFQRAFHANAAAYFTYDDHDILRNDCWPGQTFGELTWEQGLAIFAEQTPSSPRPYRTFRHGRDLQIWILEGRRYRSANTDPDGPAKTILGAEQKAWLKRTVLESDATFRVIISPTPIVGPDRGNKNDNHANAGFRHEGDELRRFLAAQKNLIVTCGDRHWQYRSVDAATGLREFGCGPSSDVHAGGYTPQPGDEAVQKFFRLKGGFLSVATEYPAGETRLAVRHHAVDGTVVHEVLLGAR